jgi:hypothetical protein
VKRPSSWVYAALGELTPEDGSQLAACLAVANTQLAGKVGAAKASDITVTSDDGGGVGISVKWWVVVIIVVGVLLLLVLLAFLILRCRRPAVKVSSSLPPTMLYALLHTHTHTHTHTHAHTGE